MVHWPEVVAEPAARRAALRRAHQAIANRLHRSKDLNFYEEASLLHCGAGSTVTTLLRDVAISVLPLKSLLHDASDASPRRETRDKRQRLLLAKCRHACQP
jgi:hypothetical protein